MGAEKIHRGNFKSNIFFLEKINLINSSSKILEIGCGIGGLTNYFVEKKNNIIGIDINEEWLEKSKEIYTNLPIQKMSGDDLEFEDNKFDVVLSFDLLEHIPDTDKHLSEVKRVLKNGGFYLLQTPNKWTNIPFEIIKEKSFTKYKSYHCSLHNYWQLKKRFNKFGFEVEFEEIPVVNEFFKQKVKKYLGGFGLFLLKFINPDKFPIYLKTNFYVVAKLTK